jgi:hypothetical protein
MTLVCGIDIGLRGAIVIIDENRSLVAARAMICQGKKIDSRATTDLLRGIKSVYPDITFAAEKVNAFQGASSSSSFTFGYNYGIICGMLYGMEARTVYCPPRDWTRWAHMGTTDHPNPKVRSKEAAERLWPTDDWSHDGITDAALIAAFAQSYLAGKTDKTNAPDESEAS